MKILTLNTEYHRGGAARVAKTLHDGLNVTRGFQSYFAYGRGPKIEDDKAFRFSLRPEIYLHAALTRLCGLQGYGTPLSTRRLFRYIKTGNFDLIHFHNLHGYYLDLSFVRFIENSGVPVVWTLHDAWPITGRCTYFFECDRWDIGCGDCPYLSSYPKTYLDSSAFMWKRKKEHFARDWNLTIVCPSRWLADKVRESYLNKYKIKVIPNCIDIEIFKPKDKISIRKKLGISTNKKLVLYVANDLRNERKGFSYFLQALKLIKLKNWMVITVGEKIHLDEKMRMTVDIKQMGYISDQNSISEVYSAADIFCISSLEENFPITVLESLACGIPIVGFKVGGIPEQIPEGCGIMVPPRNTKALGKAFTNLLQDDELREKMGKNCRARCVAHYTVKKFRERYIKLYSEILPRAT
jgi:putative colanic acid biosynthesis glycosyltransferase